jgi:hypothetical protein
MTTTKPDEFLGIHDPILRNSVPDTIKRMAFVSALGIVSMLLIGELLDLRGIYQRSESIAMAVLGLNLLSEGNVLINRILDQKLPWYFHLRKRVAMQLTASFIWLMIITTMFAILTPRPVSKDFTFAFIFGNFFIIIFNSVLFLRSFAYNWRQSLIENEQLQKAKLHADYLALQNQLNPHFLFNSFSVLISEINYDPASAIEFARKMSDVYRYVLQQRENTTVSLKEELEFVNDFMFLHQIRMGQSLLLKTDINLQHKNLQLPPMTLQVLIENAIKHNRATEKMPLQISIHSNDDNTLTVKNNLAPKSAPFSTGTGLRNITQRYKLLTREPVLIQHSEKDFAVTIPLLNAVTINQ